MEPTPEQEQYLEDLRTDALIDDYLSGRREGPRPGIWGDYDREAPPVVIEQEATDAN